jgi:hypothetical protein
MTCWERPQGALECGSWAAALSPFACRTIQGKGGGKRRTSGADRTSKGFASEYIQLRLFMKFGTKETITAYET